MQRNCFVLLLAATMLCTFAFSGFAADKIVLKLADNIPDRTQTWGAVFEELNAEFLKMHPGVEFETESYPDQPYQQKMKISFRYANLAR